MQAMRLNLEPLRAHSQVEEGLQAVGSLAGDGEEAPETLSERGLMALERKTSGQIQVGSGCCL